MTAQLTVPTANDSQTAQKIAGPYQRAALSVERALSMDDNALARIRPSVTEGAVDIFVTTPLHSVLVQRVPGIVSSETVVAARDLPAKLREIAGEAAAEESIQLTGGMDFMWTGSLPPARGIYRGGLRSSRRHPFGARCNGQRECRRSSARGSSAIFAGAGCGDVGVG